jgi:hypothetical protein
MKLAITIVGVAVFVAASGDAHASGVRHVPPASAEAGSTLELVAQAPATTPTLAAYVRPAGAGAGGFARIELVRRDDASWVAVVPTVQVAAPGVEYYVMAGEAVVFASPEWPHLIPVHTTEPAERRGRDMDRTQGRRSRVQAMADWVEFGTRQMQADSYYRFDADFSYRLWAYPLEEIRVGYTRLLGESEGARAGFKVSGWFELGLSAIEGLRFDVRGIVLATQTGFAVGARGEGRLGDRDGSHVAVGAEYLGDVGSNGFFRLGWGTVPKTPMAATVEVSQLPSSMNETGVRLYYDVGRDVGSGVRIGVRVGYAARNQSVAGFTGGAGASVEF